MITWLLLAFLCKPNDKIRNLCNSGITINATELRNIKFIDNNYIRSGSEGNLGKQECSVSIQSKFKKGSVNFFVSDPNYALWKVDSCFSERLISGKAAKICTVAMGSHKFLSASIEVNGETVNMIFEKEYVDFANEVFDKIEINKVDTEN